jgi:hypothetical protein
MEIIKRYKEVIAVVLTVLILVLIRSFGTGHFKSDFTKWAEPSLTRTNVITAEQAGSLTGNKLLICLDKKAAGMTGLTQDAQYTPPDSILTGKYLNNIRKHSGPVLLYSSDTEVSARIWMILSQMGYMNIFILTDDADIEVYKNKFRPDTLIRPEF